MSGALPITSETAISTTPVPPGAAAPISDLDCARAMALLMEGLLTEKEFGALTGIAPQDLPQLLTDSAKLAEVQRMSMELRNKGALDRLEALRHSRDGVIAAAAIMRDPEMSAGMRLNAAAFISKIAGTDRAPADEKGKPANVKISINFGPQPENRRMIEVRAEPVAAGDESSD